MNNLTTRKIILGLLMGLVLVFSVQGVAEAIENPDIIDGTLNTNTVYNVGDSSVTIAISALTFDDSDRKETLRITKSSGVALTSFGGLTSVTLTEDHSTPSTDLTDGADGNRFSYTRDGRTFVTSDTAVSIPITFTAKGKQTVTISSRDYDAGADPDNPEFSGAWSYTYTYYVKGAGSKTTTVSLLGLRNGYKTGIFEGTEIKVHNGDSSHYDVTYTSGGTLQIEQPDGDLVSYIADNRASSVFDAWLTMSATHQVTAKVTGSDPGVETVGVYIIGTPTLAVGSPGDANRDGVVDATAVAGNKADGRAD